MFLFIWRRIFVCHSFRYLLLFHLGEAVEARLKITPADIITQPGEDIRFLCSTESLDSVDWTYRKNESQFYRNIFIGKTGGGGGKSNGYLFSQRIHVDVDIPRGQYDLIIRNVTQSDEGEYVCNDISDDDSPVSAKLIVVITVSNEKSGINILQTDYEVKGEAKTEFCSYDVASAVGSEVQLNFSTTQSHSIHLEHRSVERSYPLHVFRDGRIVNDYYVLTGRFDVKVSAGVWTLVITDVQMADAGTFICSEDNGLGKQEVKELIVLEWENVGNGKGCTTKNCTVWFSGNCPPLLEWRQSTEGEMGNTRRLRNIVSREDIVVTSTRIEDEDQKQGSVLSCVAMTKFSLEHINQRSCLVITELSSCEDEATTVGLVIGIIFAVTIAILAILLFWFFKRRGVFKCWLKRSDVKTPLRQPMSKPSSPIEVVVDQDRPAKQGLLEKFNTPSMTNVIDSVLQLSSARKRCANSSKKENIVHSESGNSNKKNGMMEKAKRKLPLETCPVNHQKIINDYLDGSFFHDQNV